MITSARTTNPVTFRLNGKTAVWDPQLSTAKRIQPSTWMRANASEWSLLAQQLAAHELSRESRHRTDITMTVVLWDESVISRNALIHAVKWAHVENRAYLIAFQDIAVREVCEECLELTFTWPNHGRI